MNVLQHLFCRGAGQRHAQSARKFRQHVRGALQILVRAAHPRKTLLNLPAARHAQRRLRPARPADSPNPACRRSARLRNLPHVVAEGRRRRHAPRRGVRLLQQSRFAQRRHHIAQRRRAQALPVGKQPRHRLRCHWLAGRNVQLDDGVQHQPLTRTEAHIGHLLGSPFHPESNLRRVRHTQFPGGDSGRLSPYNTLTYVTNPKSTPSSV